MSNNGSKSKSEIVYIIDLALPMGLIVKYGAAHWVPYCTGAQGDNLLSQLAEWRTRLALLVAQGVTDYFSQNQKPTESVELRNLIDSMVCKLAECTGADSELAYVQVMRLKKLIEDYVINQLRSVLNEYDTPAKFVQRYSSRIEADQKFFVYC